MRMLARPAKAAMAAEPVSPEVAPMMVMVWRLLGEHGVEQAAEELEGEGP